MLASRIRSCSRPALAVALAIFLSCAAPALAGEPATVTVRVVGQTNQALVGLTQVTTNATPVVKDGNAAHSCPGTSALGALQQATAGNWEGPWSSKFNQYEIFTIAGESHPFETPTSGHPSHYWNFWLDNKEATFGACEAEPELHNGDSIVFFVGCSESNPEAKECQAGGSAQDVLALEAPASAEVGKPVTVTVHAYPVEGGGAPTPVIGANVVGGGVANAPVTDANGQTTMVFSGDGKYTLHASGASEGPVSVPGEAFICIHEGNDGTCGTTLPGPTPILQPPSSHTVVNPVPSQLAVAKIVGVKNGHRYSRRAAPRVLKGTVTVPAAEPLREVRVSLKRKHGGRCSAFSGKQRRFLAIRCKRTAAFFSVGSSSSFSYLLPARLAAGSYTYEIEGVDTAGSVTKLTNGVSRVVFDVR